ncbi:CRP/FNR family transcriptional regulator, anaerobic regulatory protein [Lutimaribacter pacificus]|uniref:CRP/FNR family transcriptional regulator, anaerobic regulatory protein n=1 Tax=Lutimaribacter pacificus TaxID=391948 RepID=A0A1H0NV29_9RHOB|nr:Crp/Fnr family transcriptional regulator [Lutimaribacter pacificus]SDO96612.1 CRP/FNR family transcriptional regulator, anaerobic regulatory protein [Lutimaribacter pacificus]SHK94701.1 CRP/FNR family transcriptional regulator, anaerobic regulatory protein [Lutimaribacter pacificus]
MKPADATPHPCSQCPMYRTSVWEPAGAGSVAILNRGFTRRDLQPGDVLFAEGSENRGVYCLSGGLIALRTHRDDGTSSLLRLAYRGDVIGFRSFLGDGVHRTEARALLPSRVCTVARHDAERVVHASPPVLARLAGRAVDELDAARERIVATMGRSNKARLATLLTELMERHGTQEDGYLRMHLPLSRADLADLVGVQRETVSRLIRRLEDDGSFHFACREVWMRHPGMRNRAIG